MYPNHPKEDDDLIEGTVVVTVKLDDPYQDYVKTIAAFFWSPFGEAWREEFGNYPSQRVRRVAIHAGARSAEASLRVRLKRDLRSVGHKPFEVYTDVSCDSYRESAVLKAVCIRFRDHEAASRFSADYPEVFSRP